MNELKLLATDENELKILAIKNGGVSVSAAIIFLILTLIAAVILTLIGINNIENTNSDDYYF